MHETPRSERTAVIPLLTAILCVAVGLRCLFLAKQSLWLDEFASWWLATGDLSRALRSEATNPPVYYVVLHYWVHWFGTSAMALRSLNILPSTASVVLVYRLARSLFSPRIGLMAAAYMAISTFQIYYAQEARCFSLLELFLLASTLALWNGMKSAGAKKVFFYASNALFMTLALYSHFIAVFFFAAQGLFVLVRRPNQILPYAASAAVTTGLFLPWLLTLLEVAGKGGQSYRHHLLLKLPQAYFSFIFGDSLIPLDAQAVSHIRETLLAALPLLVTAILSVLILIPFCWLAWRRWGDGIVYAGTFATVPVWLAFLVSFKVPMFDERYLMAASSFLYMTVAAAIAEVFAWRKERQSAWLAWAGFAALAAGAILLTIALYQYYFVDRFSKDQWREAVAYLESTGGPRDVILFYPDYLHYGYDYYQKVNLPYLKLTPEAAAQIVASPDTLKSQVSGFTRLWLIRTGDDDDIVLKTVRSHFSEEHHRFFPWANGICLDSFLVDSR